MKLEQAFKQYKMHKNINEGMKTRTLNAYLSDISQYIEWLKEHDILDSAEINTQLIQTFMVEKSQTKKETSLVRMAASIRSFHEDISFMTGEEDPAINIEVHKGKKNLPVFCTEDEMNKLFKSFDDQDPRQYLDHALLRIIYDCGLRVSEVTNLTINRVDLESRTIRVLGKGDKERIVPIPSASCQFYQYYKDIIRANFLKDKSNYFFINSYGRKVTTKYIEELLRNKCLELNFKKHITPHKLRHTYATQMLWGGADLRSIQEMLGHSDIATTEIYTHVSNSQMFSSYENFHPGEESEQLDFSEKKEEE